MKKILLLIFMIFILSSINPINKKDNIKKQDKHSNLSFKDDGKILCGIINYYYLKKNTLPKSLKKLIDFSIVPDYKYFSDKYKKIGIKLNNNRINVKCHFNPGFIIYQDDAGEVG